MLYNFSVGPNGTTVTDSVGASPRYLAFPFQVKCPLGKYFFYNTSRQLVFSCNHEEINLIDGAAPPADITLIINKLTGNDAITAISGEPIDIIVTAENLVVDDSDPEHPDYIITAPELIGKEVVKINNGMQEYNRTAREDLGGEAQFRQDIDGGDYLGVIRSKVVSMYVDQTLTFTIKG
jgi:hypothetical protein